MRIIIVSRIFSPEPSAASYRLEALADAFSEAGHEVVVLTTKSPRNQKITKNFPFIVKRFPVLRDRTGYVRGYLQYMSFDIPLFFRLLFAKKSDLIVCEPPPTTGFIVMIASWFRRTPYAYYAADIWSDAAEATGAPNLVIRGVRALERSVLADAKHVFSVNEGVSARVRQIAHNAEITTIGNGVDTSIFTAMYSELSEKPYFIYSGTASEWQGAGIFIQAFATIARHYSEARIVFLGQGSDWPYLQEFAEKKLPGRVDFLDTVPPQKAAELIRGAIASLASIRPDSGYNFAFPTKVFASWACGTPVLYAGVGEVRTYMSTKTEVVKLGAHSEYEVPQIAEHMKNLLEAPHSSVEREQLGDWASKNVSLKAVAEQAVATATQRKTT